ncbi:MAG: tyrosine-type recombinase/integrase, partial [Planktothrix sp.]|uniref:tyrosine-type recombinase/integrase n=1 Tax=Planktothrix sp. TaxID=3088171 RepID=UPI0038D4B9E7
MSGLIEFDKKRFRFRSLLLNSDILRDLLANKRSVQTRRAYAKDLRDFFSFIAHSDPTPELVREFLALEQFDALALVLNYRQHLINKGLKESTVNRRLAAIKSLVNYARTIGRCNFTLADIKNEKVRRYTDTSGIPTDQMKTLLELCDRSTLKGKRDYAIFRLLWSNALRRGEISNANISDLDVDNRCLWIHGKGRGTEKEKIELGTATLEAIQDWLQARGKVRKTAPLFCTLDPCTKGHRLGGWGIYDLVREFCQKAGISKPMSPHRIRHSSITAALDATGGDVRRVQKLSRHHDLNTLMIYDDNRKNAQGEITNLLDD